MRILVSSSPGELRVALAEDDILLDYTLHRPASPDGVGDLYLGRVSAVLSALGGAFVALATLNGETQNGFLPDKDGAAGHGEGSLLAVRVTRGAQAGKGPRLTARLRPAEYDLVAARDIGQGLVLRGPSPVHRFASGWPQAPIRCDDPAVGAWLHASLGGPTQRARVELVSRAFDDAIETTTEALASPEIALPGGLRASIHPTPALVAIDMDGGSSSAERQPKQSVQFAANRAAIPSLLHQIRLRNLSGAILIDLAGLASRKRAALAPDIEQALARDPLRPRLLGFTALGLAEITRPRIHPPLHELIASPHGAGLAALRAALAARGPAGARAAPVIRAGIAVISALRGDPAALAAFAQRAGAPISLVMDPSLSEPRWTIENA